jgi:hypothetical protein
LAFLANTTPNALVLSEVEEDAKPAPGQNVSFDLMMSKLEARALIQLEFTNAGIPIATSGVEGRPWTDANGHAGILLGSPRDIKGTTSAITRLRQQGLQDEDWWESR